MKLKDIKLLIAKKINEENDNHSILLFDVAERLGKGHPVLAELSNVHQQRVNLLNQLYKELHDSESP